MSVTTEQLIAQSKEQSDMVDVDYVSDTQWLAWVQMGVSELHRYVTNKFKATYFRTFNFTLTAGEYQQAMPADFMRLKGLDVDPDTVRRREVRPYNFAERNRYRNEVWRRGLDRYCADRWYSMVGSSQLQLQSQEQAAGSYRVYYTPKPKTLALVRTISRNVADAVTAAVGPDGEPSYGFVNWALTAGYFEVGNLLTISGAADDANDGSRAIVRVTSATVAQTTGTAVTETFALPVVATYATCLDAELEAYAEYPVLCAAIKALVKEESFAQARDLKEQRNLMRLDLEEAVETDAGGPQTIIDTDDEGDPW